MSSHSVDVKISILNFDDFICSVTWLSVAMLVMGTERFFLVVYSLSGSCRFRVTTVNTKLRR